MNSRTQRRLIMLALLLGGPILGWLLNGDRGLLLGLVVSLFAIVWYVIEERRLL